MTGFGKKQVRRLIVCLSALLFFAVLVIVLLPGFLKWSLNRYVLPRVLSDPKVLVTGGQVVTLNYHELVTGSLFIDAGSGLVLTVPEIRAVYSPGSLLKQQINSVNGSLVSESEPVFHAGVQIRDIKRTSAGLDAEVSVRGSEIRFGEYRAGPFDFSSSIQGDGSAFSFDVPLQSGLLTASAEVAADWKTNPVWRCSAELPLMSDDGSPIQLAALVPGVSDLQVHGNLRMSAEGNDGSAEAVFVLDVNSLKLPEKSLELKNLAANCVLRLLAGPRSLPEQKLTAQSLSIGDILLERISMDYQLEPESVLYIEELEFDFCGGLVRLNNTRIHPDMKSLLLRLSCERLSMEQVLAACGVNSFSGDGELNGRLPVQWHDGAVHIKKGFLYSTPGRGGIFSLGSSQTAAGLLPAGSVGGGQLGMVSEALSEFRYDWITMTLNSEGENLAVVVEMAGTPVRVLPYEYDSKLATYVKIAPRAGRGLRQPMQFQLNLSVPLNQLLCYASGINRQWNLFKTK